MAQPKSFAGSADGCHVHPHCLSCPLPYCIYDEKPEARAQVASLWKRGARDREIVRMAASGMTAEKIAEKFGVHHRTVYRVYLRERHNASEIKA